MQYAHPPQPTLTFFPAVLKTLSNPYPSTRPLVYNYLVHHSEQDPDTALLAINTIQKSLSDSNTRVRALALRTMSGIRVPVISQIVSLAIKKGITDLSPIVRKAAALACVKCVRLDASTRPQVEEYLAALLADKQYYVAGAAVQSFMQTCPERLDMVHPVYRRLCRMVVDMDEWGQLAVLKLMTGYARRCFPQQIKKVKRAQTREQKARDFYEDIEPKEDQEDEFDEVQFTDPDLDLFLKSIQPLLQSRNSAVIISVARAYLYLAPAAYLHQAVGPLIALLRSPEDIQQVALYSIVQVCLQSSESFVPYLRHFLIRSSEAPEIRTLKLEVLTLTFPQSSKENQDLILAELEHFSHSHDAGLVREAVKAIGRCAQNSSEQTSRRCLSLLLKQLHSSDQHLVGESMTVVRHLIQRDPLEHRKTVVRLAKNLDTLTSPTARACVVWLVGEFASPTAESAGGGIAADVLRILVKGYVQESDEVRAQIVLLAAKVYLHHLNSKVSKQQALDALNSNENSADADVAVLGDIDSETSKSQIDLLWQHTLLLARYTPSYSLRDRARTYRALLAISSSTELASLLLLASKPVPSAPSPSESRKSYALGSASLVIGAQVSGYEAIPDWVREGDEPDPKLRDEIDADGGRKGGYAAPIAAKSVSAGQMLDEALANDPGYSGGRVKKDKTLDAWLDEEEEESEEGSEEEDDDVEEEGESEYETETDEEEEEEESNGEEDEKAGLVGR